MAFNFKSLSQVGSLEVQAGEERLQSEMERVSEEANRGMPMKSENAGAQETSENTQSVETVAPGDEAGGEKPGADQKNAEVVEPSADSAPNTQGATAAQKGDEPEAKQETAVEEAQAGAPEAEAVVAQTGESTGEQVAPAPASDFDSLLRFAQGRVGAEQVDIKTAEKPVQRLSAFASLQRTKVEEPVSEDERELIERLGADIVPDAVANNVTGQARALPQVPTGAPGIAVPAMPSGAATLGDALGRAAAGAVATPFIALSSAGRHLKQRFKIGSPSADALPPSPVSAAHSMQASTLRPDAAILSSMERITGWKCDRIERAAHDIEKSALDLMSTDEFVVWDDAVRKAATERGLAPEQVVADMHESKEYEPFKTAMDGIWSLHPEKVAAYRAACADFERHIQGVVKEFANSDDGIKTRVSNAMKQVETGTKMLPGFGENVGEYQKTMAERIRQLVESITQFVEKIVTKLTGKSPSNNEYSM